MRVAGEIVERSGNRFRTRYVYPFNDDTIAKATGYVAEEFDSTSPTCKSIKRRVSWPSLGSVTPAEARAFADAIRAAADWAEKAELEVASGK